MLRACVKIGLFDTFSFEWILFSFELEIFGFAAGFRFVAFAAI